MKRNRKQRSKDTFSFTLPSLEYLKISNSHFVKEVWYKKLNHVAMKETFAETALLSYSYWLDQ